MPIKPVPTIVIAQLLGTSLWFSANGVAADLMQSWHITLTDIGSLTNAVQLGFIVGTLFFSISGLADRYAASRIFAVAALCGSLANALFALCSHGLDSGLPLRFVVGLCMAGVYPMGMKLVVSWAPQRAGAALAWLVGMLTLGSALPHGLRMFGAQQAWQTTMLLSSALALVAAVAVFRLGDGPALRPGSAKPAWGAVLSSFGLPAYRASALGYFGHQWELYAFWTMTPSLLVLLGLAHQGTRAMYALSFAVVGIGALGCVAGGWWSQRIGSARIAAWALVASALCCAVYPCLGAAPHRVQLVLMLVWGFCVVADSPHFSALSAKACPPQWVGSALALQTAIGFAITMVSIQMGTHVIGDWGLHISWLLLPGPVLGLWGLAPLWRNAATDLAR